MQEKRVFLYCRKSSESEDRQSLSIPSQIKELKQTAKSLGLTISDIFEESKSAKAPGRLIFGEMMHRLYKKEAEGILCWKLDRLARNPVDGGTIIWAIKDQGIEIITPSQTYCHGNENTILMYVEFGIAQKFIDDLGKNSKRGMKTKAEMGWYPAPAPLGYKNTPDKKKGFKTIVKDKQKFTLVRKLFDTVLSGKQASQVYGEASKVWKLTTRSGAILSRSAFYNILNNPFYYGDFEWPNRSGTWYKGEHEPMITKEEFDLVQKMLGKLGKPIAHNHNFDLTGLFRCSLCGCAITATKKIKYYKRTDRTVTYIYYHCTKKNPKIQCDAKPLTEKEFIEQINALLLSVTPDIAFIQWAKKWLSVVHKHESNSQEDILKSQQSALGSIESRLNKLLDMRLNDLLDDPSYKQKKAELEKEKKDLKEKLADADGSLDNWRVKVETALDFAYACQKKFENGTRDEKHEVMVRIGENLLINPQKRLMVSLKREYGVLADKENWDTRYKSWREPQEWTAILVKTPDLRPANPVWLPRQDSNLQPSS